MTDAILAAFNGAARIVRRAQASLPFGIEGVSGGQKLMLAFTRAPSRETGDVLTDVSVESPGDGRYILRASEGTFELAGARHFLHLDAGSAFYQALPPFSVPWTKRALWRALLILARLKHCINR